MDAVALNLAAGRTAYGAAVEGDLELRRTLQVRLRGKLEYFFPRADHVRINVARGGLVEVLVTKETF